MDQNSFEYEIKTARLNKHENWKTKRESKQPSRKKVYVSSKFNNGIERPLLKFTHHSNALE